MPIVIYHSPAWNDLVEQGWVTMFVETIGETQWAIMTRCENYYSWRN